VLAGDDQGKKKVTIAAVAGPRQRHKQRNAAVVTGVATDGNPPP
jgi:hypothetical protein